MIYITVDVITITATVIIIKENGLLHDDLVYLMAYQLFILIHL